MTHRNFRPTLRPTKQNLWYPYHPPRNTTASEHSTDSQPDTAQSRHGKITRAQCQVLTPTRCPETPPRAAKAPSSYSSRCAGQAQPASPVSLCRSNTTTGRTTLTSTTAAEKRDADHEITKAHLANLDATESDARTKGGFFLAAHELMVEEVQKHFDAYERDEERAWYEMDKMWMAKLLPDRRGFEIAGGEGWKRWCDFMNHCERHVLWYETTYGVPTSKWGWA
jgi:hypothetical protein